MNTMSSDYKSLLLTLKEQFDDGDVLDKTDVSYLFDIIDLLERRSEGYEKIIREGRHIISD